MKFNAVLALSALAQTALAYNGEFSVLAMNVAGLPAILQGNDVPGDKSVNSRLIGQKFSELNLDIVNVQEDFNYHAKLYEGNSHPHRTATSGGVPFGSGLNTMSNFPWTDFQRVKWDVCSNASGADCLTPKGFTFMRVRIAGEGSAAVYADVYNLHADAGTKDEDLKARTSNMRQVAAYIQKNSVGNPVVVLGDTNSRYSRVDDVGLREFLASQNPSGPALKDAWVEVQRGGVVPTEESLCSNPSTSDRCETVDKIFFRGSPLLDLTATAWGYYSTRFLQPDGNILSDHNPVFARLAYSSAQRLQQSDFVGGPHGNWYSDAPALALQAKPKTSRVVLRGSKRVDSVAVQLADGTSLRHGGSGGDERALDMAADEFWTATTMCQAQRSGRTRVFYIKATTSKGRTVETGQREGDCFDYAAPAGWQVVGFAGSDGDEMDRIALIYARQ
ncbi:hypothetical protein RB595_007225 [Gaeumannomyces hyphopodioides]